MGLRIRIGMEKDQGTTEDNTLGTGEPTECKNRVTVDSDDQLTLLTLLSPDQEYLDQDEDTNGISLHGPSHRGPRVLLTNHQEDPRIG